MKHCPKCGASEKEKKFVGQFCVDCFLEDNPDIVTFRINPIDVCVHCGRIRLAGKWHQPSENLLLHFLRDKMKTKLDNPLLRVVELEVFRNKLHLVLEICGSIRGEDVCVTKHLEIKLRRTQCPICTKAKGEYWEAKIQLRGDEYKIEQALAEARKVVDSLIARDDRARIWRTEEKKEGIDILLGAKKVAREVVKRLKNKFGAEVKETYKLTGEDVHKGKRKYKVTYSVRLKE